MTSTKLQNAVFRQLGYSRKDLKKENSELRGILEEVCRGGASAGWSGFNYYEDTVQFTKDNRAEILKSIKELASDLGENPVELIKGFNCFRVNKGETFPSDIENAIGRFVYGGTYREDEDCDIQTVYNALAWYALEEVARDITDN
jgi:hypothetical protein